MRQVLASKVRLDMRDAAGLDFVDAEGLSMDTSVRTAIKRSHNRQLEGRLKAKDRSDRATVETVLDPRTRMVGSQSLLGDSGR